MPLRVLIVEGHRNTGKSTVMKYLGNKINYATRINLTGFPDDGDKGLSKIATYYQNWFHFLENSKDEDMTIIFDRHMFSEVVYSRLYKSYDFYPYFTHLLRKMVHIAEIKLVVLQLDSTDEILRRISSRDKVEFATAKENLNELLNQRAGYSNLVKEMREMNLPNLDIEVISIDETMESKDVGQKIVSDWEAST